MIKLLKQKKHLLFFSFSLFYACRGDYSKQKLEAVTPVCNNVFVETYMVSTEGAHGGDRISAYLTDSINFRVYIRTYDDAHERLSVTCKGDSVSISHSAQDAITLKYKIVDATAYNIRVL